MIINRFEDTPVTKFYWEFYNQKILLFFDDYIDENQQVITKENVLIIEKWRNYKIKETTQTEYNNNMRLGIITAIYFLEIQNEYVYMMIGTGTSTIDVVFEGAIVMMKEV